MITIENIDCIDYFFSGDRRTRSNFNKFLMSKVALIFGVTGQDGSYLSSFYLKIILELQ